MAERHPPPDTRAGAKPVRALRSAKPKSGRQGPGDAWKLVGKKERWHNEFGEALVGVPLTRGRFEIVLTIAHLNHTPGDDRDENLEALCQYCHLQLDREHHAETCATRKDAARPLLQAAL